MMKSRSLATRSFRIRTTSRQCILSGAAARPPPGGRCCLLSSMQTPPPQPQPIWIPPNLTIDPNSKFAPKRSTSNSKPGAPSMGELEGADAEDEDGVYRDNNNLDDAADAAADAAEDQRLFMTVEPVQYVKPLPDRLNVEVHTLFDNNKSSSSPSSSSLTGTLWLDASVFGLDPIRVDLLKRAVDYWRAKKRGRRTAKTKTISEVSGSGRKLRPQKGQGRARVGHSRPPHHRGGAKAHGPKNATDYGATKLNKKVRRLALRHALSQKLREGNLTLLDSVHQLPTHKTKDLVALIEPWGWMETTVLLLDHYEPPEENDTAEQWATPHAGIPVNLHVASKNLYKLSTGSHHCACVYTILRHEKLVLTVAAMQKLEERLREVN